jgi:GxxExxY protein
MNIDRDNQLSGAVIGAAIAVHRELGPGLLRSAYEECLCHELTQHRLEFKRQHPLPLSFEGQALGQSVEVPLLVAGRLPVFCLSAATLSRLHEATLLARLRQGAWPCGLLLNFNVPALRDGLRRISL